MPVTTSPSSPSPRLNFYGLEALGYEINGLTGNWLTDQLTIEAFCFRINHTRAEGGLDKFGHFRRYVDLTVNNPDLECQKRFIWNPWAEKMLRKACETGDLGVAGPTSAGKCLSPNELCLMHDGTTKMFKDICVGDSVMTPHGGAARVKEVHAGFGPMMKVTPQTGEPWFCTPDHTLVLQKVNRVGRTENFTAERFSKLPEKAQNLYCQIRATQAYNKVTGKYWKNLPWNWHKHPIKVTPAGDGPWVGFSVESRDHQIVLGDFTVTHNSDPFALWAFINYLMDPTHTLIFIMSTTLSGAKRRIWKTFKEYWESIPNLPGKALWSTNEVMGLNYQKNGYGQSSGVRLLASEQSNEKSAIDNLIGAKAPMTQGPDGRKGKLILIVDEMTGMAESLLNAVNSNMKPGNAGVFQFIGIGNPNSYFDSFGIFCQPKDGWQSVTLQDEEWETATGGLCIRFNGENNPRITEKNDNFSWMLTEKAINDMAQTYGRDSLYFYRMALGMWSPQGVDAGIYTQADIVQSGSMGRAVWGFKKPVRTSALDPSFTNGGDRASCTFTLFGEDPEGKQVLMLEEEVALQVNISDTKIPISYQLVYAWKKECEKRGVLSEDACFDSTGGGIVFADVVKTVWSSRVLGITSAGKALKEKDVDTIYDNRATQIWCSPHALFRSGQIKGITTELAKQLCSRQYDKNFQGDGRVVKVESKRVFKAREGSSPDESDSFLLSVEHARLRKGFKATERAAADPQAKGGTWETFKKKAHRITNSKRLNRE